MAQDNHNGQGDDPLYLDVVYPEAGQVFSFAPLRLDKVIEKALFVLDTNALLVPYGTSRSSLAEIEKTYRHLATEKRLIVPGQAAREFGKHRPEHLKTLYDQLAKRQSLTVSPAAYPLLSDLKEYEELLRAEGELSARIDAYRGALRAVMQTVGGWYWDDPVSRMYRAIFDKDVVTDTKTDAADLRKDMAFRAAHKVPPGYKDGGKELNAAGDLLMWRIILELGASRKVDIVFVSGEEKADWWHRSQEGPLYPRYELVEEFRRRSGGRTFHIIRLAELLEHFGAEPEVVKDVREQEALAVDELVGNPGRGFRAVLRDAIHRWAARQGISAEDRGGNGLVFHGNNGVTGVRFHFVRDATVPFPWIRSKLEAWLQRRDEEGASLLILGTADRKSAVTLTHRVSNHLDRHPERPTPGRIVFGYLNNDEFRAFAQREDGESMFELKLLEKWNPADEKHEE